MGHTLSQVANSSVADMMIVIALDLAAWVHVLRGSGDEKWTQKNDEVSHWESLAGALQ